MGKTLKRNFGWADIETSWEEIQESALQQSTEESEQLACTLDIHTYIIYTYMYIQIDIDCVHIYTYIKREREEEEEGERDRERVCNPYMKVSFFLESFNYSNSIKY